MNFENYEEDYEENIDAIMFDWYGDAWELGEDIEHWDNDRYS